MTERAASIVLIVSFLGLFTAVPAFAEDLSAQSVWAAAPPRIDGLAEEWNGGAVTVHKKTKAECAFRNDADNLYILLAFKDPAFLSTLDKSGVTIFFDAGGKNRKDRGLKFTKAMLTADQLIARRRSQGRELTEEQIAEIKGKPFHPMFMFGVINKNDHALMAKAKPSFSPDFNASQEGDVRVYEIKIPLIRDDNQPFGIG
ncbi:MAG: hypothetical protein JW742_00350, partial [Candidatus Aminicenantes bacterium]|nr:hypothetical protein [Candidatus Aminicenantes bacterium]